MNKVLFDSKVEGKGLKYTYLAKTLGISNQALIRKRDGNIPFKVSEIKVLKGILELTDKDICNIFFT